MGQDVGIFSNPSITVDLSCDNVYGPVLADWSVSGVVVSSATDFTVDVPQGFACYVELDSYFDGTNTFSPIDARLTIDISSTGVVSAAAALEYTNGASINNWFGASAGVAWNIAISYASDIVDVQTVTDTTLVEQDVTIDVSEADAPDVTDVTLFTTPAMNGADANYTLTAVVSGATGCVYIDTTINPYDGSVYSDVNTAYNDVAAVACPSDFVDGVGQEGNWDDQFATGDDFLIIWANGNAYTTATVTGAP